MIGKPQLNDKPELITRADAPLKKVNFDLIAPKITSLEGYNYRKDYVDYANARSVMSFRFVFLIYILNIISITHII